MFSRVGNNLLANESYQFPEDQAAAFTIGQDRMADHAMPL